MTDAPAEPAPNGAPYLSPSRLEKVDTCARAYAFRYLDGIRAPDKPSAAFGTLLHLKLQFYFLTRVLPISEIVQIGKKSIDVAQCAIAGLQYLPLPDPSLRLEHEWRALIGGAWFTGKIDVYDPTRVRSQHVNANGTVEARAFEIGNFADVPGVWSAYDSRGNPIPLIIDHKSTGDFKWLKTADVLRGGVADLKGDPQPGFYGSFAAQEFEATYGYETEWIHFRWVYYLREEGESRARCTDLRLRPSEIAAIVACWGTEISDIYMLHNVGKSGNETPPKLTGCEKFGGCEYGPPKRWSPGNLNICRLSDGERLRSAMATNLPLSAQVAAFMSGGAPTPAPTASPFGPVNPPEAQAASAVMSSSPFGAVSAVAPTSAPAANPFGAVSFGGSAPQAPAASPASPFGAAPVASAIPQGNPFGAVALGGFTPTAPVAPPVDPRLAECLAQIPQQDRARWLAHCDQSGLDHKTGLPKNASAPAVIPAANPASIPGAPEATEATFRTLAQRLYDEGRTPDASTSHPELVKFYNAICTMYGPPKNAASAPVVEAPKKTRRKKKDAAGNDTAEDDDSPQIVITVKAIDEMIAFLQSLKASAPQ